VTPIVGYTAELTTDKDTRTRAGGSSCRNVSTTHSFFDLISC